jgi:lipopolysaccharide export system permease protein
VRVLNRYVGRHIVRATLVALTIILALLSVINFVDDLGSVGKGGYTLWRAIEYLVLTMPRLAYSVFPLAALFGCLIGLGILATNSELTVMRAAGVSQARIVWCVLKVGALMTIVAILLGEVIAPRSERVAEGLRSVALSDQVDPRAGDALWVRDGMSYVNARHVLPGNQMHGVYIYRFDNDYRLSVLTYAERARYVGGNWLLEGVRESQINAEGVRNRHLSAVVWESLFTPEHLKVVAVRPESLSVVGLYRYIGYRAENGLSRERYQAALGGKLIYPLTVAVMMLLGVVLVLGSLRSAGMGQRVMVGALIGVVSYIGQQTSIQAGIIYGLDPLLSAVAPTGLFLLLTLGLMWQWRYARARA